jgi:hypothetical protein
MVKICVQGILLLGTAVLGVATCGSVARAQESLPTGAWTLSANGFVGELNIVWIDGAGNLGGTAFGEPILGFYDQASRKITFMRLINPFDPSSFQIFTGFFFRDPLRLSGVDGWTVFSLTGYFEAFGGGGGYAQRSVYGFHAQIGILD